jgi:hypothetical protein
VGDRRFRGGKCGTVRETIGRHVDDAHEPRLIDIEAGENRARLAESGERIASAQAS